MSAWLASIRTRTPASARPARRARTRRRVKRPRAPLAQLVQSPRRERARARIAPPARHPPCSQAFTKRVWHARQGRSQPLMVLRARSAWQAPCPATGPRRAPNAPRARHRRSRPAAAQIAPPATSQPQAQSPAHSARLERTLRTARARACCVKEGSTRPPAPPLALPARPAPIRAAPAPRRRAPSAQKEGSLPCTDCQGGKYAPSSASSCATCAAGTYSKAIAGSCLLCPAGNFSAASASICGQCSAGTASSIGSTGCTVCLKGTAAPAGSGECAPCANGTYSPTSSSTSCSQCPSGTYSNLGKYECSAAPL
mmetsp:Transcript_61289/g.173150  ORF Transcript_61289/g.173150 Transcript_61289/m.173150 type:complete len:312 (+) Transcript_61289:347-1282(+)